MISAFVVYDFNRVESKLMSLTQNTVPHVYFANTFSVNFERLRGCIEAIHFSHDTNYAGYSFEKAVSILDSYNFENEAQFSRDKRRLLQDLEILLSLRKQVDSSRYDTIMLMHRFMHTSFLIDHTMHMHKKSEVFIEENESYITKISMQMIPDINELIAYIKKQDEKNTVICKTVNEVSDSCKIADSIYDSLLGNIAALESDLNELSEYRLNVNNSFNRVTRSLIKGVLYDIEHDLSDSYQTLHNSEPYVYIFVLLTMFGLCSLIFVVFRFIVHPISSISNVIRTFINTEKVTPLPETRIFEIGVIRQQIQLLLTNVEEHREDNQELKGKYDILLHQVYRDSLTKVHNRHYLNKIITDNKRPATNIAVLMCDIDKFKKFNDTHGHLAGDDTLRQIAKAFKITVRGDDRVFRYGGEEFCIILTHIDMQGLSSACIRLNRAVEKLNIINNGNEGKAVTVSIGAVLYDVDKFKTFNLTRLINIADHALYRVKKIGGNSYYVEDYYDKAEEIPSKNKNDTDN